MSRRFVTLDVFTSRRLCGNPLAVVLDGEGLDQAAMQAIAREFNLSETVFVRPPADPQNRAALRIFTPGRELPFAGHPTVGAAALLALQGGLFAGDQFVLEEQVGLVPCAVTGIAAEQASIRFRLPRLPAEIGAAAEPAAIAAALGLPVGEIGFPGHVPTVMSAGVGFTLVPVRGLEAVARAWPQGARWAEAIRPAEHANAFVYARETIEAGHSFHARMFAPDLGVMEDPATGSAVAAFAGAVMAFDQPADGTQRLVIEQGYEMGRPSQIELTLEVRGGTLEAAFVGGSAVIVSEGTLRA